VSALTTPVDPPATEVRGPSALGTNPKRLIRLTWALAVTEFRLKFFGSALGYLWQLMRPLMLFGVLYGVFSVFLDVGENLRFYPVALLLGIVLFSFFSEATSMSVRALVNRENLVRKIEFPRLAVPLATVLTALFNLGLNLVPVLVFLIASGGTPRLSWLEMPFIVAILALFALGLAMLLSVLFVRYRDIEPIWDVVLQVLFYATPIFYPIELVVDQGYPRLAKLLMCSPLGAIIQQARHALIDPSHSSVAHALGSYTLILIPLAVIVVVLAAGFAIFDRQAPRIAEEL
jgi:ABC-2 type transport system permease protein